MNLITNNYELMDLIPNSINPAKGETTLFDKIAVFIARAEEWARDTFTSHEIFDHIAECRIDDPVRVTLCRLVAFEALRDSIPSLDLVFTPNGFAITQTSNLTPASKQRVDRLVSSMVSLRDDCIARLLTLLVTVSPWLESPQALFFGSTLFPTLSVVDQVGPVAGSKWDKYLELRPQMIDLEASIAEGFISPELLDALRSRILGNALTSADRPLVTRLQAQIVAALRGAPVDPRRMADCVNYIRQRPEDFPEWHNSSTAELFTPPVFKNKKDSPGYFF